VEASAKMLAAAVGSRARLASEMARENSGSVGGGESARRNEKTARPRKGLGRRRERSSVEASGETARRVGNEWAWRAGKGSGSGSGRASRAAAREETAARRWEAVKGGSGVEVGEYDGGQGAG
jgi:hypothetical protein